MTTTYTHLAVDSEIAIANLDAIKWRWPCERHRRETLQFYAHYGIRDGRQIETYRRALDQLVEHTYTAGWLQHWADRACMHCRFEESGSRCYEWVWNAMRALVKNEPTPPRVVKTWTDRPVPSAP